MQHLTTTLNLPPRTRTFRTVDGKVLWYIDDGYFPARWSCAEREYKIGNDYRPLTKDGLLLDGEFIPPPIQLPCQFDHNGECLVCDGWMSDCPFAGNK